MKTPQSQQTPSGGSDDRLVRLLPCPFCGTESGTPTGPMYLKNGDMWEGMMHDVHCINCTTTMSDYSREKVEAKWNLRSLPNEKGTGRRVDLLCAASQDPATGEIVMTPLAQMFMGNPYDMFDPPESEGHEETACRGLPN